MEMIAFKSAGHLTLGVEIELQLIHPHTLDLTPVAPELFKRTAHCSKIKPESFQSFAEINTGICRNVQEVAADLRQTMTELRTATDALGVHVATTGTHPFARYAERKIYSAERYHELVDRNQWIMRRLMICGLHVHIGMRDGDSAIRFNNFFLHLLPHLLALSASSPFWQGEDTGLSSSRITIFESCPTAGHPCRVKNWTEFCDLTGRLMRSKAIFSLKDLWWDIRPNPDFGTIELRMCDSPSNLAETLALVAFVHALAHWYDTHGDYDGDIFAPFMWMMRENKWRAARHGLGADLIHHPDGSVMPLMDDIRNWMHHVAPIVQELGYESHFATLEQMLTHGNSSTRQKRIYDATGSLQEVARFNVQEFQAEKAL